MFLLFPLPFSKCNVYCPYSCISYFLLLMFLLPRENNISTYFIVPPVNRRKPHMFNTLNVRGQGGLCTNQGRSLGLLTYSKKIYYAPPIGATRGVH